MAVLKEQTVVIIQKWKLEGTVKGTVSPEAESSPDARKTKTDVKVALEEVVIKQEAVLDTVAIIQQDVKRQELIRQDVKLYD